MTTKKPITEAKDPAVAVAEKAWERLHSSSLEQEQALIDIIKGKLWEPIGFETFAKAWAEKMADVRVQPYLAVHVVYALLDEEIPLEDITDIVKGVGPETVEDWDRKKGNGVPADLAGGGKPKGGKEATSLSLYIGAKRLAKWNKIAARFNLDLNKVAVEWIETRIDDLDNIPEVE